MQKNSSVIQVEKTGNVPGIYLISNKKENSVYIGQAKELKRRMMQHVKYLFLGCDNNASLQKEFDNFEKGYQYRILKVCECEIDELDFYERLYYIAAKSMKNIKNVHNKQEPNNSYDGTKKQIEEAINTIKDVLEIKNDNGSMHLFKSMQSMRDWIEKSNKEIINDAKEILNNASLNPCLGEISIKELHKRNKIGCIMLGVAGDYVKSLDNDEKKEVETITEILATKIADIALYGKCLWATAGPEISLFKEFYKNGKFNESKKLYVLFRLTVFKFSKGEESVKYSWTDDEGIKLYATSTDKKTNKALVIKNIWTVKEDFEYDDFEKLYYRYDTPATDCRGNKRVKILNSDNLKRQSLYAAVSIKEILNNEGLREVLKLKGDLLGDFNNKYKDLDIRQMNMPEFEEDAGTSCYIIAEIENYVEINNISPLSEFLLGTENEQNIPRILVETKKIGKKLTRSQPIIKVIAIQGTYAWIYNAEETGEEYQTLNLFENCSNEMIFDEIVKCSQYKKIEYKINVDGNLEQIIIPLEEDKTITYCLNKGYDPKVQKTWQKVVDKSHKFYGVEDENSANLLLFRYKCESDLNKYPPFVFD